MHKTPLFLHALLYICRWKKKKMLTDPLLCKIHPHTLRGTSSTDTVNIDTANEAEDKDRTLPV